MPVRQETRQPRVDWHQQVKRKQISAVDLEEPLDLHAAFRDARRSPRRPESERLDGAHGAIGVLASDQQIDVLGRARRRVDGNREATSQRVGDAGSVERLGDSTELNVQVEHRRPLYQRSRYGTVQTKLEKWQFLQH